MKFPVRLTTALALDDATALKKHAEENDIKVCALIRNLILAFITYKESQDEKVNN